MTPPDPSGKIEREAPPPPPPPPPPPTPARPGFWLLVLAGAYLTLRGYHAFDGDQAYRLPLLLHRQHADLFANDPFVRAFDAFNPHRGYLALLDVASRPLGLATGLAVLFGLTLAATMLGVARLTRVVGPDHRDAVGLVAVGLVLLAKAGNIGTNHLFEATLLDRLIAFALGWQAIAALIADPGRGLRVAMPALGLAAIVHPSVGLQLTLTLGATYAAWGAFARSTTGMTPLGAVGGICLLGLALVPGLTLVAGQGGRLLEGMPLDEFRRWAVEVQGPQHMLPSTWRLPQWLAFGCYPTLAGLAWTERDQGRDRPAAGLRFGWLLVVNLASLVAAYVAVAVVGEIRVTIFQPFRMATLARGLCLVAIAGHCLALWDRRTTSARGRGVVLAAGLTGDWTLVVASVAELVATFGERIRGRDRWEPTIAWITALGLGVWFLSRHDTEQGHLILLCTLQAGAVGEVCAQLRPLAWNGRRRLGVLVVAWAVPVAALLAGLGGERFVEDHPLAEALVRRCRFAEIPVDDLERVARWSRAHTPPVSRFIGPPGEKGFRLWSERSLAFNRAGSPYNASGLSDWSERFRDHVGFVGSTADFARAYLAGRHELEAGYERLTPAAKLALARRQGADYILDRIGSPRLPVPVLPPGMVLATRLGRYAVYHVVSVAITPESAQPARTGRP